MPIQRLVYCLMAGVVRIARNSHAGARVAKTHAGGMSETPAAVVLNPAKVSSNVTATGTVLAEQQVDVQTEIAGK